MPQGGALPQRVSLVPVVIAAQVPLVPPVLAAEQALQAPVHAVLQQNPSAQKPEAHWLAAVQVPPLVFLATQAVPEQKSPAMQSVSAAHVSLHAVAPQTSGEQVWVATAGQAPAPLQLAASVATPLAQLAARHAVVAGATAQTPPAAQAPVFPQGGALPQRLSLAPVVIAAQVPLVPPVLAAEQALHAPAHAVLQQNPSAQNPDVH